MSANDGHTSGFLPTSPISEYFQLLILLEIDSPDLWIEAGFSDTSVEDEPSDMWSQSDSFDIWIEAGYSNITDDDSPGVSENATQNSTNFQFLDAFSAFSVASHHSFDISAPGPEEEYELELYLPTVQDFFNLPEVARPTNVSFDCICCAQPLTIRGLLEGKVGERKAARLKCKHILCLECAYRWWMNYCKDHAPCPFCREPYQLTDVSIIRLHLVLE